MKKLILLASFLAAGFSAYAAEQVYFKIAVNEHEYSTFLTDRVSNRRSTLQYLATRMREPFFNPEKLNTEYYEKKVVQYDIIPKDEDRFRHLIMVNEIEGNVIRKEVYDIKGKLVFAFTDLDNHHIEDKPDAFRIKKEAPEGDFKGFHKIRDKKMKDGTKHMVFSDGLNGFSVFKKKASVELSDKKRILYGNYVLRKKIGKNIYTVVGSIPFNEMDKIIEFYAKLEEKK
jgi:sigma-E factor negative regulatory protein RseB